MNRLTSIPDDILDAIIADKILYRKTCRELADKYEVSTSSISKIHRSYEIVKQEKWDELKDAIISGDRTSMVRYAKWAASRMGKEIPPDCWPKKEEKSAEKTKEGASKQTPVSIDEQNTAMCFTKLLEMLERQNIMQAQLVKEMREQTELLTQFMDTVIPHWVVDLKDCVNTNADLLCQRVDENSKIAEAIKCNVRRRGA